MPASLRCHAADPPPSKLQLEVRLDVALGLCARKSNEKESKHRCCPYGSHHGARPEQVHMHHEVIKQRHRNMSPGLRLTHAAWLAHVACPLNKIRRTACTRFLT